MKKLTILLAIGLMAILTSCGSSRPTGSTSPWHAGHRRCVAEVEIDTTNYFSFQKEIIVEASAE